MIVTCEHCAARYKLDPGRITGRGVRITCPRCKNVFVVYRSQAGDEAPDAPDAPEDEAAAPTPAPARPPAADSARAATPAPSTPGPKAAAPAASAAAAAPARAASAPAPAREASAPAPARPAPPDDDGQSTALFTRAPAAGARGLRKSGQSPAEGPAVRPSVESLDFASVGIQAWKVKVRIGLVYDFSDYKTLARYIKDGRVGDDDQISHDGKTWTRLGDLADLEEHFIQTYLEAKRAQDAAPPPQPDAFDDEGPTKIVGASEVAKALPGLAGRGPASEDDDLAAATAAAMAAEDDDGIGGPGGDAVGPRFQDPFARSRASRGQPARRASPPPSQSSPEGNRSRTMLLAAVALVAVAGAGAWAVLRNQEPAVDVTAETQRARKEEIQALRNEQAQNKMREDVNAEIQAALGATPEEEIGLPEEEDDILIPVNKPTGARGATTTTTGAGGQVTIADASGGTITTSVTTPADHYSAGRSAYNAGRYQDAVSGFRQAVGGAPGNSDYHYWLGLALNRTGSSTEAMLELKSAAQLGNTAAYKLMGDIAARQGDVPGAIGYYQQYLATGPSDAAAVQDEIARLTN